MCIRTDYPLEHSWVVIFNDEAGEKTGIVKWKEKKVSVGDNTCRAGIEFLRNQKTEDSQVNSGSQPDQSVIR